MTDASILGLDLTLLAQHAGSVMWSNLLTFCRLPLQRTAAVEAPSAPAVETSTSSGHSSPEELRAHLIKKGKQACTAALAPTMSVDLLCFQQHLFVSV